MTPEVHQAMITPLEEQIAEVQRTGQDAGILSAQLARANAHFIPDESLDTALCRLGEKGIA